MQSVYISYGSVVDTTFVHLVQVHIPHISGGEQEFCQLLIELSRRNDEVRRVLFHFFRKEGSQESSEQQRSAACTPSLEDNGTTIEDGTTVEYWDSFGIGEEPLPDLSIESSFASTQPEEPNISGRRIVSLSHFVDAVRSLDNHMCPKSTGRFVFVKERRVGLWSELMFSCTECGEIKKLTTDPVPEPTSLTDKTTLGINDAAVWAFMSIGSGHSQFEEAMSIIEVPVMSKGAFLRREESLGKVKLFTHTFLFLCGFGVQLLEELT